MPTFVYDFRFLQASAEILEDFLLASDIYWPVGIQAPNGETPYPQLSLGCLALAQARAQVKAVTQPEKIQLDRVLAEIQAVQSKRRVAWENKAANECRSRLTQWRNFLEDYQEKPAADYNRFSYEVTRRVILHLLSSAAVLSAAEQALIAAMDALLASLLVQGEFIWEVDLQAAFPKDVYWFLYGRLPKKIGDQAE